MIYKMLGIDIDGTLIHGNGRISERNVEAIGAAQDAGVYVVPCTGRAWHESRAILDGVAGLNEGVFITGAAVSEVATGRCVNFSPMEPSLAFELIELLRHEAEAVLVHHEPNRAGYDYLVTGQGQVTENSRWWFETTGANVRHKRNATVADVRHCLRVGMVASGRSMPQLVQRVEAACCDRVWVHAFAAVQQPDPNDSVYVLEIFAAGVDKWRGLSWIAAQRGIECAEIATIGDEINDVSMVGKAGCGVAMANAVDPVKAAADYVTTSSADEGVAVAIGNMLEGKW